MLTWLRPLLRRYARWLPRRRRITTAAPLPAPAGPPRPKPKPLPPGPRVLMVGGGWDIEQHAAQVPHPVLPSVYLDPCARLLVSPNRRHFWVWPPRLTAVVEVAPCCN